MVTQCPNVNIELMQTVDATVSEKNEKKKLNDQTADQARVCAYRNFMKSRVAVDLRGLDHILEPKAGKPMQHECSSALGGLGRRTYAT